MENYLTEAFKKLSLVENDFDLSADNGKVDELKSFIADDIEAVEEEPVIDVDAYNENDLADNYVGKVILECNCCHTRIYKDIDQVVIDEESGLANIDEECPSCGNSLGWIAIGKIEPFNKEEATEETEEPAEEPVEDDITDEEISEAFKSVLAEKGQKKLVGLLEDIQKVAVKTDDGQVEVDNTPGEKVTVDFSSDASNTDEGEMIVPLGDEDINNIENNDEENVDDLNLEEPEETIEEPTEEEPLEEPTEDEEETEEATEESEEDEEAKEEDDEANESYKLTNEKYDSLNESKVNSYKLTNESFGWPTDLDDADPEDRERYEIREEIRALEAKIRDLISQRAELADAGNWDEYRHLGYKITELRSKVKKLENKLPKPTYDDLDEGKFIDNRETSILTGDPYEDSGFAGFDIDDFDEESYDDICESFLKRVYENAQSFKTTSVKQNKNSFIVEGIITFNSGNKKSTAFEFNKVKTSKKGKVILEGKNTTFSKSGKSFLLKANLQDKRLIPEALNYNFRAKSSLNESIAIKGRVKK